MTKGYTYTYGIDYLETFALIAKMNVVKIMLSLQQFDIKNVFLQGNLKDKIYIETPPRFGSGLTTKKVCKLKKALYEINNL